MTTTLFVLIWILFGFANYRATMAYFKYEFPIAHKIYGSSDLKVLRYWYSMLGPIGFIIIFFLSKRFKHGFKS